VRGKRLLLLLLLGAEMTSGCLCEQRLQALLAARRQLARRWLGFAAALPFGLLRLLLHFLLAGRCGILWLLLVMQALALLFFKYLRMEDGCCSGANQNQRRTDLARR